MIFFKTQVRRFIKQITELLFTFLDLIYIFVISFNINNNKLAKSRKITIVTAADKSHYQSSIQLIKSILSTNNDVVVYFYDLEIETELIRVLQDERIIYKKLFLSST